MFHIPGFIDGRGGPVLNRSQAWNQRRLFSRVNYCLYSENDTASMRLTSELGFRLGFRVGFLSWIFELGFRVGFQIGFSS